MSVTKDPVEGNDAAVKSNGQPPKEIQRNGITKTQTPPPKISLDTSSTVTNNGVDHTAEFIGDVDTDNTIPSQALLHRVADFPVLGQDGKSRPFKNLYSGPMVARRVLVIFVRHFFCGVSYAPLCYLSPVSFTSAKTFCRTAKHTLKHFPRIYRPTPFSSSPYQHLLQWLVVAPLH